MGWHGPRGDCGCCEDDPCPEERTCDGEYPSKVSQFKFSASGITDTMTGFYERTRCLGYEVRAVLGVGSCCIKTEEFTRVDWSISGFAALNGDHNYTGTESNDVCIPGTLFLRSRCVPITGEITFTYTKDETGFPEGCSDSESVEYTYQVCGWAALNIEPTAKRASIGVLLWYFYPVAAIIYPHWVVPLIRSASDPNLNGCDYECVGPIPEPAVAKVGSANGVHWANYCNLFNGDLCEEILEDAIFSDCEDVGGIENCTFANGGLSCVLTPLVYSSPEFICPDAGFSDSYTTYGFADCDIYYYDTDTDPVGCTPPEGDSHCNFEERELVHNGIADGWTLTEILS